MTDLATVSVEDREGLSLVRIRGEIDISNARDLAETIERSIPNEASAVTVDLTETSYLDSAGIQLLFTLAARLRTRRREMTVIAPEDSAVRTVLDITGMQQVMAVRSRL